MKPSKYQQDIYNALVATRFNVAVAAGPGSGKTSTAVHLSRLVPHGKSSLFIAFNKSIVNELKTKLVNGTHCSTLHSLGLRCIFSHFPGENKVDAAGSKQIRFIEPYYENLHPRKKWVAIYRVDEIMKRARVTMTPPDRTALEIMCDNYAMDYDKEHISVASRALKQLYEYNTDPDRFSIQIDFIDMIEMVAHNNEISTPQYDYVFLDEAQDMSKLDQKFIRRLIKPITGRLFAIGDRNQSIYSFRGADPHAFEHFLENPNTIELPLSVSYRCAKSIVKEARLIYKDVEEWDQNPEGVVRKGEVDEIEEGDMVLCRNTRPLISIFLDLIDQNKKAYVVGKEMEKGLLGLLAGFDESDETNRVYNELENILKSIADDLEKRGFVKPENHPKYVRVEEKLQILHLLFRKFKTVREVEEFIKQIFHDQDREGVRLMTIHKSKGLENERVFIIETFNDKPLIPSRYAVTKDQLKQERNLKFVAITRAKRELIYLYL